MLKKALIVIAVLAIAVQTADIIDRVSKANEAAAAKAQQIRINKLRWSVLTIINQLEGGEFRASQAFYRQYTKQEATAEDYYNNVADREYPTRNFSVDTDGGSYLFVDLAGPNRLDFKEPRLFLQRTMEELRKARPEVPWIKLTLEKRDGWLTLQCYDEGLHWKGE
jgi:hypothetical protein